MEDGFKDLRDKEEVMIFERDDRLLFQGETET